MKNCLWILCMLLLATACAHSGEQDSSVATDGRSGLAPGDSLIGVVRSVGKLVVGEMVVTKMASVDDLKPEDSAGKGVGAAMKVMIDAVKIGDRKAAYSYDTYMRAYIDMTQFDADDVRIDTDRRKMWVRLPEVKVEFAGREAAIREEHYRVTGLRSDIGAQERARIKEELGKALKKEVEENGELQQRLKRVGRSKASDYFRALGAQMGYEVVVESVGDSPAQSEFRRAL